MVKGKFKFYFSNGSVLTDRNGYKTLTQAKSWAKANNKYSSRKIIKVVKL